MGVNQFQQVLQELTCFFQKTKYFEFHQSRSTLSTLLIKKSSRKTLWGQTNSPTTCQTTIIVCDLIGGNEISSLSPNGITATPSIITHCIARKLPRKLCMAPQKMMVAFPFEVVPFLRDVSLFILGGYIYSPYETKIDPENRPSCRQNVVSSSILQGWADHFQERPKPPKV